MSTPPKSIIKICKVLLEAGSGEPIELCVESDWIIKNVSVLFITLLEVGLGVLDSVSRAVVKILHPVDTSHVSLLQSQYP